MNSCGSLPGSINLNVSNPSQQDNCQFNEVSLFQVCNAPSIADGIRPTTGEYIVLSGPVGTDISCYSISDGDWVITLPTGSTINENGLFSIGFDINYGENHFDLNLQGCNCATMRENLPIEDVMILTNSGEFIMVFNNSGTFIDGFIYGNPSTGSTAQNTPVAGRVYNINSTCGYTEITTPPLDQFKNPTTGASEGNSYYFNSRTNSIFVAPSSFNDCTRNSTPPIHNFLWSTNATTSELTNLQPGIYSVTITNNYGCTTSESFEITHTANPLLETVIQADCSNSNSGSIDLTITDNEFYEILWSNEATTTTVRNLSAGEHIATLSINECSFTYNITVPSAQNNESIQYATICQGEIFLVGSNEHQTEGSFTDVLVNQFGCDSTVTTHLTVLNPIINIQQNQPILEQTEIPNALYQWINCETQETVGNEAIFTAPTNGLYKLILTLQDCTVESDCYDVANLGVKNMEPFHINIYPNPITDVVHINTQVDITSIELLDNNGRIITEQIVNGKTTQLDLNHLQNGIYLLQIQSKNQTITKKLIKQ